MTPFTITRSDWEEPGWTIAEHTGSPPVDWSRIEAVTVHYPGSSGSWTRTPTERQVIDYMRSVQRSYVNSRGYSYGYNVQVWGEHIAEGRGDRYRNAANGVNNSTKISVQVKVPGQNTNGQPATAVEVEAVRKVVAWAQEQAGRELYVDGHRDNKPTGCPGSGLYQQVQSGVFLPDVLGDPEVFTPMTETRLLETREEHGGTGPIQGEHTVVVPGAQGASAAVVTLTAVDPSDSGFVTAWSAGTRPNTSKLNYQPGDVIANTTIVALDGNGAFKVFTLTPVDLLVDLIGRFG